MSHFQAAPFHIQVIAISGNKRPPEEAKEEG